MTSWEGLGKEKRKNENTGRNNKTQTLRERRQKVMNVVVEHKHMGVKTPQWTRSAQEATQPAATKRWFKGLLIQLSVIKANYEPYQKKF